jgi:hypothetical protein
MPRANQVPGRAALQAVTAARDLLASQLAAHLGLPAITWPRLDGPADTAAVTRVRDQLTGLDLAGWRMTDIGAAYEHLLTPAGRKAQGTWYTPA